MAAKDKPKVPVIAKIGESTYKINAADLRIRERIALEEYLGKSYTVIISTDAIFSEKAIAFIGYLAVSRRNSNYDYDEFLDLLDADGKASVQMRADDPDDEDAEGKKSERPTKPKSRKTSGKRSTAS